MPFLSSILQLSYHSSVLLDRLSRDVMKEYDISLYERDVLLFLSSNRIDTASDIVKYRMISKSLVCKAVGSLIAREYLVGERDENDRRCIHLRITDAGRKVADALIETVRQYYSIITESVPEKEIEGFIATADRLRANASNYLSKRSR
ncbi:MAG: winged helix-turn-helix transcriptional regulator [Clostridia bacterium]|nr:winged helix-turn-helix transcriptional regulator [Clostridia bacterium]